MSRPVAIVTGASSGIGLETARKLYLQGLHVVLACRSKAKSVAAQRQIQAAGKADELGSTEVQLVDFADFKSVVKFSECAKKKYSGRIYALVLNAGLNTFGEELMSHDKLEVTWQVNFLAQYALALTLLPELESAAQVSNGQPARLVFLSSLMHWFGHPADFEAGSDKFLQTSYASSKLACTVASMELHRRLVVRAKRQGKRSPAVTCTAVNPGGVSTSIYRNLGTCTQYMMAPLQAALFLTSEQAGQVVAHAATGDGVTGGSYWAPLAAAPGIRWRDSGDEPLDSEARNGSRSRPRAGSRSKAGPEPASGPPGKASGGAAAGAGGAASGASYDSGSGTASETVDTEMFLPSEYPRSWWQWSMGAYAHETLGLFAGPQRHVPSAEARSPATGKLLWDVAEKQLRELGEHGATICDDAIAWLEAS